MRLSTVPGFKHHILAHFRGRAVYFEHAPFPRRGRLSRMRTWLLACHAEMREALQVPPGMHDLGEGDAILTFGPARLPLPAGCAEMLI